METKYKDNQRIGRFIWKKRKIRLLINRIAPGMNDGEELDRKASEDDVKRSDHTEATTLSYDEVEPS
ncbi:hypothetical protein [Desmospora profundinema]|uniref:Uncharacterized protein n=1 Tax=Desmospora profundinema TaxID=1571184 RepID=A0ABU1IJ28_9BACL|nr:hypothetical protein [Desmospora profundinema]MDR6224403.1 hypothetical protein [Desmospora profundinema]